MGRIRQGGMIYKRGQFWHFAVKVDGAWVRRSSESTDRRQAQRMQLQAEERVRQGLPLEAEEVSPGRHNRLSGLLEGYIEHKHKGGKTGAADRFENCLPHLLRHLGNRHISPLRRKHVDAYIETRLGDGVKPGTVQKEIVFLRAAFNWAKRQEWVKENPAERMAVPNAYKPRDRALTEGERLKIFADLDRQGVLDHIQVLLLTAIRKGELQGIEERDCDLHAETILLRQTKTGESRTIPMAPAVKEIIWRRGLWQEGTKDRKLFAAPVDPRRNLQRALQRAKLEHATLHDLRATAATDLYLSGGDPATTMKVGGWKDPRTPLRIYARVDLERARAAVNRLPGMGQPAPDEAETVAQKDGIVTQL